MNLLKEAKTRLWKEVDRLLNSGAEKDKAKAMSILSQVSVHTNRRNSFYGMPTKNRKKLSLREINSIVNENGSSKNYKEAYRKNLKSKEDEYFKGGKNSVFATDERTFLKYKNRLPLKTYDSIKDEVLFSPKDAEDKIMFFSKDTFNNHKFNAFNYLKSKNLYFKDKEDEIKALDKLFLDPEEMQKELQLEKTFKKGRIPSSPDKIDLIHKYKNKNPNNPVFPASTVGVSNLKYQHKRNKYFVPKNGKVVYGRNGYATAIEPGLYATDQMPLLYQRYAEKGKLTDDDINNILSSEHMMTHYRGFKMDDGDIPAIMRLKGTNYSKKYKDTIKPDVIDSEDEVIVPLKDYKNYDVEPFHKGKVLEDKIHSKIISGFNANTKNPYK